MLLCWNRWLIWQYDKNLVVFVTASETLSGDKFAYIEHYGWLGFLLLTQ